MYFFQEQYHQKVDSLRFQVIGKIVFATLRMIYVGYSNEM